MSPTRFGARKSRSNRGSVSEFRAPTTGRFWKHRRRPRRLAGNHLTDPQDAGRNCRLSERLQSLTSLHTGSPTIAMRYCIRLPPAVRARQLVACAAASHALKEGRQRGLRIVCAQQPANIRRVDECCAACFNDRFLNAVVREQGEVHPNQTCQWCGCVGESTVDVAVLTGLLEMYISFFYVRHSPQLEELYSLDVLDGSTLGDIFADVFSSRVAAKNDLAHSIVNAEYDPREGDSAFSYSDTIWQPRAALREGGSTTIHWTCRCPLPS